MKKVDSFTLTDAFGLSKGTILEEALAAAQRHSDVMRYTVDHVECPEAAFNPVTGLTTYSIDVYGELHPYVAGDQGAFYDLIAQIKKWKKSGPRAKALDQIVAIAERQRTGLDFYAREQHVKRDKEGEILLELGTEARAALIDCDKIILEEKK